MLSGRPQPDLHNILWDLIVLGFAEICLLGGGWPLIGSPWRLTWLQGPLDISKWSVTHTACAPRPTASRAEAYRKCSINWLGFVWLWRPFWEASGLRFYAHRYTWPQECRLVRKQQGAKIPADLDKKAFLDAFRRIVSSHSTAVLEAASCHAEGHQRKKRSTQTPEVKYLMAIKTQNYFPHKRLADAFYEKHRIRISFSFHERKFEKLLGRLLLPVIKSVDELDKAPAKYPASLKLTPEQPTIPKPEPADAGVAEECEQDAWTSNEGESSDDEEEMAADPSLRGQSALVTAACPRKYPRDLARRRAEGRMIPEDFGKQVFLAKLRQTIGKHCTAKLMKASSHDEPHKRFRPSKKRRERHIHAALLMSGNFAHKKVRVCQIGWGPQTKGNRGRPFWWHVGLRWLIEARGLANRSAGLGWPGPVDKSEGFRWAGPAQGPSCKVEDSGVGPAKALSIQVRDWRGGLGQGTANRSEGFWGLWAQGQPAHPLWHTLR